MLNESGVELDLEGHVLSMHKLFHQQLQVAEPVLDKVEFLLHIQEPVVLVLYLPLETVDGVVRGQELPLYLAVVAVLAFEYHHLTQLLMRSELFGYYFLLTAIASDFLVLTGLDVLGVLFILDLLLASVLGVDAPDDQRFEEVAEQRDLCSFE